MRALLLCSLVFASAAGAAETDPEPTDDVVAPKQKAAAVEAAPAPAAGADAPAEAGFVRDRVRSVAPAFSKRGRVALTALGSVSINDAFFTNLAAGLAVHGYLRERLAVGVRGGYLGTLVDDDARIARANLQSAVLATHPVWHALAEVEWSPFYGKLAAGDSILYLDAFITSGLGAVGVPRPGFAFELGGGVRLALTQWLAVSVSVLNTTYSAPAAGTQLGLLQNLTLFTLGVSVFLPARSDGGAS